MLLQYLKKLFHVQWDANHPLLGPNLALIKLTGVWHPANDFKTKFKRLTLYCTVGFFFSLYVKCCISRSLAAFKPIIQFAPFHIAIVKSCYFLKHHAKWTDLIGYISSVERGELSKKDPETERIIKRYIKYGHRLTYFYWVMGALSNVGIYNDLCQKVFVKKDLSEEYISNFDGYTPWKRDPPGYYYIFITQVIFANMVTAYVMAWDPLVVGVMIFFANQLKISGIYCRKAIEVNNPIDSQRNIVACHRFHSTLVKYQETFNGLISSVMFVYLVVISVNLGVCIMEMVELQDNFGELLSYCLYVLACLIQLLVFYWHSNEVTEQSTLVSYNTFRSNWVDGNKQLQKQTALLGYTVSRKLVFHAGPFNEMSLTTFVSILRGSYSFYTLLNETN